MLYRVFFVVLLSCVSSTLIAQIKATTEGGNHVLLFDDGTWKYDERRAESPVAATATVAATAAVVAASVDVDSTVTVASDLEELFYEPSPRLVKFFGDDGGNVRCKIGCSNTMGEIKLHFQWEFPVHDSYRYFGWFKQGTVMTFTLDDGTEVSLETEADSEVKRFEKRNYSAMMNSSNALTMEQLVQLTSQPVRKMEVEWKKKPEEYEISQTRFLMEAFQSVL